MTYRPRNKSPWLFVRKMSGKDGRNVKRHTIRQLNYKANTGVCVFLSILLFKNRVRLWP